MSAAGWLFEASAFLAAFGKLAAVLRMKLWHPVADDHGDRRIALPAVALPPSTAPSRARPQEGPA